VTRRTVTWRPLARFLAFFFYLFCTQQRTAAAAPGNGLMFFRNNLLHTKNQPTLHFQRVFYRH